MLGLENPLHILLVLLVVLLVFGAKRLPELGRSLGSGMREFKDSLSGAVSAAEKTSGPEPARLTSAMPEPQAAPTPAPTAVPAAAPAAVPTSTPMVAPTESTSTPMAAPTEPTAVPMAAPTVPTAVPAGRVDGRADRA